MAKPIRPTPALERHPSEESQTMLGRLATVIGEPAYQPVARLGRVHVYRVTGSAGTGLLAERNEAVPEVPGVVRWRTSAWVRRAGRPEAWIMDGRFHDVAGEAVAPSTDWAAPDQDTLAVSAIPVDAVPALMAGLTPDRARELAAAHAPELVAARVAGGPGSEPPPQLLG